MAQLSTTMIQLSFYFILMFGLLAFIYLLFDLNTQRSYFNGNARHQSVSISGSSMTKQRSTVDVAIRSFVDPRIITYNQILRNLTRNNIDLPSGEDAFVFLHIQKTAGTSFERFLVKKLNTTVPCICEVSGKKRCNCRNKQGKIWLFSRYSTGWVHSFACGLHADFTQLMASRCVDNYFQREEGKRKNRLYLTTFLREPIDRFISEYSHVQRGATWKGARHFCNGRLATREELPPCYDHGKVQWNVSGLDEFLACPHNLAFNRQTRMLTDLTLVNCYNKSSMEEQIRNEKMLASAIDNLRRFAFFGIKEQMAESQFLFEATFDLRFDGNLAEWNKSKSAHIEVNADQLASIRSKNQLDLRLYEFARELFHQRLNRLGWSSHQQDQVVAAGG